ncbi:MAG: acylphosphatase [Truepera sp.]|nr:acylphosphatase [Truepera sp.]
MEQARLTVLISGCVQGVGYRAFARRQALELGLSGYTENLPDGRVEVVAEGDRTELQHYLHLLQRGPVHARVQAVEVFWAEAGGLTGFYVY